MSTAKGLGARPTLLWTFESCRFALTINPGLSTAPCGIALDLFGLAQEVVDAAALSDYAVDFAEPLVDFAKRSFRRDN